jgi:hypothetical protein
LIFLQLQVEVAVAQELAHWQVVAAVVVVE